MVSKASGYLNVFEIHVGDTAVMAGEYTVLRCDIEGASKDRKAAEQYWTNSVGTTVTAGTSFNELDQYASLTLNNIQKDARYNCHYSVGGVWYERSALVDVFSVEVVDDVVMAGVDATPHCHVYGLTLPIAYFTWRTSSSETAITTGLSKSGSMGRDDDKLTVTVDQDMTYRCTVNVMTYVNTMKTWTFNVKVDFVVLTHDNVVGLDDAKAVLTCGMTGAQRSMDSYSWSGATNTLTSDYTHDTVIVNQGEEYRLVATVTKASYTKNQGTWDCSYVFDRSASMNMKSTLTKSLAFDVAKWVTIPEVSYVESGDTATYSCQGAATSATSIKPSYAWKINGVASSATMAEDVSKLTFTASGALDGKSVSCTASWASVNSVELTATALLYSKYVHVYPTTSSSASDSTTVVAVKGEDLVVTCVYSSTHKPGSVEWYKGVTRISANSLYSMSKTGSDANTETYQLNLKSVSSNTLGTYKCVYKFTGGNDWTGTITVSNVVEISSLEQLLSADIISGYSGTLKATVSANSAVGAVSYSFFRGTNTISHTVSGNTASANTGNVIYRTQRNTEFDVEVTWKGSYQTLVTTWSKLNGKKTLRIVDSCAVSHSNINSITSLNNTDNYVVTNTAIKASCAKGYIIPSDKPYTRTCSADTTMTFDSCTGGCYVTDLASNSKSSHEFKDSYKLQGSGYTTTHYNTIVELNCGTYYTLPRESPKTLTCNSNSGQGLSFAQKCVVGCKWTKNANNAAFTYLQHDKSLIASGDSVTYVCSTNTMTGQGSNYFTKSCDSTAAINAFNTNNAPMTLALDECKAFTMAAPTFNARINSVKITFATPSYPSAAVTDMLVSLLNSNGDWARVESRYMNSNNQVAFFNLETETVYRIQYIAWYTNGGSYKSDGKDSFTTTAPIEQPTGDAAVKNTLSLDVPMVDFTPGGNASSYGMLVVYKKDEYIGDVSNMKFVPVYNYNSYYGDRRKRDNSVNPSLVPGEENQITVYVYPTSQSLYNSGADIGAFYSDSIAVSAASSASYSYEYNNVDMKRSATYYFILRGCTDQSNTTCSDGSPSIVDMNTNHDNTILIAFFTTLCILLILALLIFLFIHFKVWYKDGRKQKRRDVNGVTIRNPRYGY